jgi:hypothetical protein
VRTENRGATARSKCVAHSIPMRSDVRNGAIAIRDAEVAAVLVERFGVIRERFHAGKKKQTRRSWRDLLQVTMWRVRSRLAVNSPAGGSFTDEL